MKYAILGFFLALLIYGCVAEKEELPEIEDHSLSIRAADLSFLPLIRSSGIATKNRQDQEEDMLLSLKNAGMNTVRIRIWHHPDEGLSGLEQVKLLASEIHQAGLELWLCVHYSDTWADPGNQSLPAEWRNITIEELKDSVRNYTSRLVRELNPTIIQMGNEINGGFLWPWGRYPEQKDIFISLLQEGVKVVREYNANISIMLHFAGIDQATIFFNDVSEVDYDMIGISYYPWWHGKDLNQLESTLDLLKRLHYKKVVIAETAYPFTLDWNDYTHNVVGLQDQLILPEFSASPAGQHLFMERIREICNRSKAEGFAYWGGEWVAYDGTQSEQGSSWENLALWDFEFIALPAIEVFRKN
ncbi:MAG TPA: glycosyl hydrolase 53 family protein [Saprospiraceae bacterium]|nr:glycosyl hydrolase 53 family protein [Saprospiraceae bacterium]